MIRRMGFVSMVALASFLLCGATAPEGCQPAPQPPNHTGNEVAAAVGILVGAVVGTIVLVEVNKSNHTIKGCVSAGPNGLQVRNDSDKKTYALLGVTASTKAGDIVQLHGTKEKKTRDSSGDPSFVVQRVSRDYGPCKLSPMPPANPASPAGTQ